MRIFGIDFTSAPSARKPISCAMCRLEAGTVILDGLCEFDVMDSFANFLAVDGPWVAGIDFPFGLPRDFLAPLSWRADWSSYVARAAGMERGEFRELARTVSREAPIGQRNLNRRTDTVAGVQSPMNVARPPVGLMFHAGAPMLLSSDVSVLPMRKADEDRLVFEACPELVVDALIGRRPYKDDTARECEGEHWQARSDLLDALAFGGLLASYNLEVEGIDGLHDELLADTSGDRVDALMCAVQAAWAWERRDEGYGFPDDVDAVEGWIADPATSRSMAELASA